MTPWLAIAWREQRMVRLEAIVLAAAGLAGALLAAWSRDEGVTVVLSALHGTLCALVLGAGLFAGDPAPAFLASRAVGPLRSASARLAVRAAALAGVVLVSWVLFRVLARAETTPDLAAGRSLAVVLPFHLVTFLSAAVASAFVKRPLEAAFVGGGVATLANFAATASLAWSQGEGAAAAMARSHATFIAPALAGLVALLAWRRRDAGFDPNRLLKRGLAGFAALLAVAVVSWLLVGNLVGRARLDAAMRAWTDATGRDPHGSPWPAAEASADAQRADAIARRLGITLLHEPYGRRWQDDVPLEVHAALRVDPSEPMPEAVRADLEAHVEHVAELSDVLARGDVRWPATPQQDAAWRLGADAVTVARLLAWEAKLREDAGDPAGASAALDGLRGLVRSRRAHPGIRVRLEAADLSRIHAHAVRALRGTTLADMDEEVATGVLREEAWQALTWQAGLDDDVARGRVEPSWRAGVRAPPIARLAEILWAPWIEMDTAHDLREAARGAGEARARRPCDGVPAPGFWSWTVLDGYSPEVVLWKMTLAELEWDLTRVVLALRDPAIAARPEAVLASRACPGRAWSTRTDADGRLVVEPWPEAPLLDADGLFRVESEVPAP